MRYYCRPYTKIVALENKTTAHNTFLNDSGNNKVYWNFISVETSSTNGNTERLIDIIPVVTGIAGSPGYGTAAGAGTLGMKIKILSRNTGADGRQQMHLSDKDRARSVNIYQSRADADGIVILTYGNKHLGSGLRDNFRPIGS